MQVNYFTVVKNQKNKQWKNLHISKTINISVEQKDPNLD